MAAEPNNAPPAAETPAPPKESRVRRAVRFLLLPALFAVGFGASVILRPTETPEPVTEPEAKIVPAPVREAPPDTSADRLPRADQYLAEANYPAALVIYRSILAEGSGLASGSLLYRVAVCLEGLGNFEKALPTYRAAGGDPNFAVAQVPAQLGQARSLARLGRGVEARQLLYPLVLAADPARVPAPLVVDAQYVLALIVASEATPHLPAGPAFSHPMPPPTLPIELELDLRELRPEPPAKDKDARKALATGDALVLEPSPDKVLQQCILTPRPVAALFEKLVKAGGFHLDMSKDAHAALDGRTARLRLQHRALSDVLLCLADQFELVARFDSDVLHVGIAGEGGEAEFREELARRALRGALLAKADHRLAAAVYLHLAHLDLADQKPAEAGAWCEKILAEAPTSSLTAYANYDLGLLHAQRGDYKAARTAFYRLIDQSPSHPLAPLAYLHIGRMNLEAGELRPALSHLRRAHALTAGSEALPLVLLHLAAASVLDDAAQDAVTLLGKNKGALQGDGVRLNAAFLDGLARYRLARRQGPARRESVQLVAALAAVRDDNTLGPLGRYLQAQAYRDLNLAPEAVTVLEKTLADLTGPLIPAVRLAHAEALMHLGRHAEAVVQLEKLAENPDPYWAAKAYFQLATLDLHEGRLRNCVQRCARLWQSQHHPDPPSLFQLWGLAHERLGDYEKAARCFSGTVPD